MWNLRQLRNAVAAAATCLAIAAGNVVVGESDFNAAPELTQSSTKLIQKTVFSSRLRLVFFAGLEGTGHHLLFNVFKGMYHAHDDLEQAAVCLGRHLFMSWSMSKSPEHYSAARNVVRQGLQDLVALEAELGSPGTVLTVQRTNPAQSSKCSKLGMLSYPSHSGPDKALAYPDVQMLAELAEEVGVDLRVLYLQRSATDLLVSTVVHRNFQENLVGRGVLDVRPAQAKFVAYVQILMLNLAALHSGLAELAPSFVECFFYDEMSDPDQAGRVAEFVSPNDTVAEYFRSMLLETAREPGPSEGLNYQDATVVVSRLQNKLDVLEAQCCRPRDSAWV